MPKWLLVVRKALGKLTDWLSAGRSAGLWNRKPGPVHDSEEIQVKPDAPQPRDYRRH